MKIVMIHGLGQTASVWENTLSHLPKTCSFECPGLFEELKPMDFSYPKLLQNFFDYCNQLEGPLHLCGLSLGGTLALDYASAYPEKVASLVLIGAQYKIPAKLMKIQNWVFRLLPNTTFKKMGLSKGEVIQLTGSMMTLDLTHRLKEIKVPTLILCGEKDAANKKAAQELKSHIPQARLEWVAGAGHEVNLQKPKLLAQHLKCFYPEVAKC
ncbi:MAG: alpha/beta fold hydrolase [Turicibacter sp.]|nr:alpha/beta fold hydrolase [Turicibacter sp.]